MSEGQQQVVAYSDGPTWVTTEDGPVELQHGDTLPDNVHPNEVARLANAGLLEGIALEEPGTPASNGNVDEVKVRVGQDPDLAREALEAEQGRKRPRTGLVDHLEGVIAAAAETTDPGPASPVDPSEG